MFLLKAPETGIMTSQLDGHMFCSGVNNLTKCCSFLCCFPINPLHCSVKISFWIVMKPDPS